MSGNFRVKVNPAVLRWAIDRSGYDIEGFFGSIIERFPTKYFTKEYFLDIIEGRSDPKLSDIKKFDTFLKRGIPFYFISFIPDERILTEFRMSNQVKFSPEAELKLRRFHELRGELKVLMTEHYGGFERTLDIFNLNDDPLIVSKHLRDILKYDPNEWTSNTSKDVFEHLRRRIEDLNVFVFKDDLVEGIRGCIFLGGDLPPLILIKTNDDKNGEIFTLIHEFSHYLLNDENVLFIDDGDNRIEKWCDHVTSLILMNSDEEVKEGIDVSNRDELLNKDRVNELSRTYKMSKNAIMLRYLKNGIITENIYKSFLEANFKQGSTPISGGGNYHYTNRDRLSRKFISLVHKSYTEGYISLHDTMKYLRIKDNSRIEQYLEVVR